MAFVKGLFHRLPRRPPLHPRHSNSKDILCFVRTLSPLSVMQYHRHSSIHVISGGRVVLLILRWVKNSPPKLINCARISRRFISSSSRLLLGRRPATKGVNINRFKSREQLPVCRPQLLLLRYKTTRPAHALWVVRPSRSRSRRRSRSTSAGDRELEDVLVQLCSGLLFNLGVL